MEASSEATVAYQEPETWVKKAISWAVASLPDFFVSKQIYLFLLKIDSIFSLFLQKVSIGHRASSVSFILTCNLQLTHLATTLRKRCSTPERRSMYKTNKQTVRKS